MLELDRPPYAEWRDLLTALREGGERGRVAYAAARDEERGNHDANQEARDRVVCLMSLDPRAEDVDLARYLLREEIAARRTDSWQGAGDTLARLSVLLVRYGGPEDAALCWAAKRANFDTLVGGYDLKFVFGWEPADQAVRRLRRTVPEEQQAGLDELDLEGIAHDLPAWRATLDRRFPRSVEALGDAAREAVAELFGDREAMAFYGLRHAATPQARAQLYRRLERWGDALSAWREAVTRTDDPWDRISLRTSAMTDAVRAGASALEEARAVDAERPSVQSFSEVGLGRAATQACYEASAASDDPTVGRELFELAERWRAELVTYTLAGLEAGVRAAWRWGTPEELSRLERARDDEQAQIDDMFTDMDPDP